jgi:hypothetical protein
MIISVEIELSEGHTHKTQRGVIETAVQVLAFWIVSCLHDVG